MIAIVLTHPAHRDYAARVTAKSVTGIGVPNSSWPHRPQDDCGFFVRAAQHPSFGRLGGGLFGGAGSHGDRYANAAQSPTLIGVAAGGLDNSSRSHTMTKPARPLKCPDTPENFFSPSSNLEPGLPIDAINCQISRTMAVVLLLASQFDGTSDARLADKHIANALWAVQGDLERLHALCKFGWESCPTDQEGTSTGRGA